MDIFVGSLPFKIKENELRELFETYGEVASVKIIINKATRMKKGFGFVAMPDDTQALQAIKALNGAEVMERKIEVSRSEEKRETPVRRSKKTIEPPKSSEDAVFKVWTRKLYPKKKKEVKVDYPGIDEIKAKKTKGGGIKSAKNFKVGSRKKS